MIIKHEPVANLTAHERVEGWWANTVDPKKFGRCRHCGTRVIAVPKTGHINSVYWKLLQRLGKETLVCCPRGCTEELGDITFRMSHTITGMVTPGGVLYEKSEFVMDSSGIGTRSGDFIFPEEARGMDQEGLENAGWMFVDHGFFTWKKPLTGIQQTYLHCFCISRGIDEAEFKEGICASTGSICLKNLYEK